MKMLSSNVKSVIGNVKTLEFCFLRQGSTVENCLCSFFPSDKIKQYFYLLLVIPFLTCLTACGGGTTQNMPLDNTPESVAVNFIEALYRLDSEKVQQLVYSDYFSMYKRVLKAEGRVDPEGSMKEAKEKNRKMKIRVTESHQSSDGIYMVSCVAENFLSIRTYEYFTEKVIDVVLHNENGNWKAFTCNESNRGNK